MEIEFTKEALKDLKFWRKIKNKKVQERISELLLAITQDPFEGIGNPEPLKHQLSGCWSRRINKEHRLIYKPQIDDDTIVVLSLRFHY